MSLLPYLSMLELFPSLDIFLSLELSCDAVSLMCHCLLHAAVAHCWGFLVLCNVIVIIILSTSSEPEQYLRQTVPHNLFCHFGLSSFFTYAALSSHSIITRLLIQSPYIACRDSNNIFKHACIHQLVLDRLINY